MTALRTAQLEKVPFLIFLFCSRIGTRLTSKQQAPRDNCMLDHPITVVLNVFDTSKNNGLKVYKFMSIQTREKHIHQFSANAHQFHEFSAKNAIDSAQEFL